MTAELKNDLIWAAALFVGEGSFGVIIRKERVYLIAQISMCDQRALERFARAFDLTMNSEGLAPVRVCPRGFTITGKPVFNIKLAGIRAELVAAAMQPYMENTDKYDQLIKSKEKVSKNPGRNYTVDRIPNVRLSEKEKEKILELRNRGVSQVKIGLELNRSRGTVQGFLRRAAIG